MYQVEGFKEGEENPSWSCGPFAQATKARDAALSRLLIDCDLDRVEVWQKIPHKSFWRWVRIWHRFQEEI